ncbi:MAG: hypothetical protein JXA10_02860 [Anaerolineae bacterium]|nr:hypothetical protein [Anaerolineae bacterium]
MRTLSVVLLMVLLLVVGVVPLHAESPDTAPLRIDAVIEHAEVVSDAPLVIYVEGYFPSDCDMPANYEIEQWGNEVRVSIYQVALSETACARTRAPIHENLPEYLFADLTPDTYYLDISGYALRVRVRDLPPETPVPTPVPLPPVPEPPPVQWIERDLCVGDVFEIEPFSPTDIYHSINVKLQDVTRQQGEIMLNYMRGQVRLRRETSRLLTYRGLDRGNLMFAAIQPGEVTGNMQVLTESISPYGYQFMLLAEYRLHITDCDFPPPPDWIRSYAVIESVDVIVLESYPMQLHVHVRGHYSQGCAGELIVDQWQVRNHVYVDMYQLVNPAIMCPAVLRFFDKVIPLEGSFESGRYWIHVNDFMVDVEL